MAPPHPGMFIREEILDELGLSVSEAAKVLDIRRATLSDLINGNAALSAEMALRIEKAFGVQMETLLNLQSMARRPRDAPAGRRDRRQTVPAPRSRAWPTALHWTAAHILCPFAPGDGAADEV
jgi:addiction module HigA family antidote